MDILLVNPPVNRLSDIECNYYPLGLGYLAAITNASGYETAIYNAELSNRVLPATTNRRRLANHGLFIEALEDNDHAAWQEFREVLAETRPRIVGFSCTSASLMPCLKMAREAKDACGAVTVFGGMHPTLLPRETARDAAVDYVVAGEAEQSFRALAADVLAGKDPRHIPGVGGGAGDAFRMTGRGPLDRGLDLLPLPDRDALVFKEAHREFLQSVVTSRGCPYRCTFCSGRDMHEGFVRFRSIDKVIDEIEFLRGRYGIHQITFYDDALVLKRSRIAQLCRRLVARNMRIRWNAFTRADSLDEELVRMMKSSGCFRIGIGVESGSDRVLARMKKGYDRATAMTGVRLAKNAGFLVDINIIVGLPYETEEDIRDSISLIRELNVYTNINTFTPYPGSELYEECVARGLLEKDVDWTRMSQHSMYNNFIDEISPDRYRQLLDEMITVADSIEVRRPVRHYLDRAGEIWEEYDRNLLKFSGAMAHRAATRIRRAAVTLRGGAR